MDNHLSNDDNEEIEIRSMKFSLKPVREISISKEKDKKDIDIQIPSFSLIAQNFNTVLQMLWKYMHSIGAVAQKTSVSNLASIPIILQEIVEREKKALKEETPIAEFEFEITIRDKNKVQATKKIRKKVYDYSHVELLDEFSKCNRAALRILNESALQQIVNAYENVLCNLLTWHFYNNPGAVPKDKEISYRKILSFSSLEEAKRHIIDSEIENFLKRKGTNEQIKYIKDELKADIASHFRKLPEFKEIMLRRHAIVHAGGIASKEYIRKANNIKGIDISEIEEGKTIPLSAKYVINSWNVIYSMGVIILHLVAKECARSKRSKKDEDQADKFLINSSFNCIQNDQLDAAESILIYAHKLKLADDPSDLMVLLNLAQTYRWKGNIKDCENLISTRDWSAYNSLFQLCVAALRDDESRFKTLLFEVAASRDISITDLYEWPVFRLMRAKETFNGLVKEVFGAEIKSVTNLFKPKVIDINPDKTIQAFIDYLHKDSLSLDNELNSRCKIES